MHTTTHEHQFEAKCIPFELYYFLNSRVLHQIQVCLTEHLQKVNCWINNMQVRIRMTTHILTEHWQDNNSVLNFVNSFVVFFVFFILVIKVILWKFRKTLVIEMPNFKQAIMIWLQTLLIVTMSGRPFIEIKLKVKYF